MIKYFSQARLHEKTRLRRLIEELDRGINCQNTRQLCKLHVADTLYLYHTLDLSFILQPRWELGLLICLVSFPSVPLPSFHGHGALIWQSAALSLRVSHNYQGEQRGNKKRKEWSCLTPPNQ